MPSSVVVQLTPRWVRRVALLSSAMPAGLGVWWTVAPEQQPFTGLARMRISALLADSVVGLPLVAIGVAGAVIVGLESRLGKLPGRVTGLLIAAVLLAGYQGYGTLSAFGYLLATCVPLLLPAAFVAAMVVERRLRVPLTVLLAITVTAGIWAGYGDPTVWKGLIERAAVLPRNPFLLVVPLILASCAGWLSYAVVLDPAPFRRALMVLARYRRPITIAAAACFVPYAVVRLLWLAGITLESLVIDASKRAGDMDLVTRLWGASLGVASILGGVAVLGLICRWGEVFPRWIPRLGGRPVPISLAVVPGLLAGLAFSTILPMAVQDLLDSFPTALRDNLIMPFLIWGPLIILAVLGYLGHRLDLNSRSPHEPVVNDR